MKMRGRIRPIVATLQSIWLKRSSPLLLTSRAFSNQIIKSPSLLSLDITDSWSSAPEKSDYCSVHECADIRMAQVIDGKAIAYEIRSRIADEVTQMKKLIGKVPGLAVVVIGHRRDSQIYVHNKIIACEEVGIKFKMIALPEDCTECEVCSVLHQFNEDPSIHGILVQLPLPLRHHATVTVLHPYSKNPEEIAREADILVTAAGVPNLVRGSWLKPGAVVVDVGTTPIQDASSEDGFRLVGDVYFPEAISKASAITPVPGGVGPMTVAMLLFNTLKASKRVFKFS